MASVWKQLGIALALAFATPAISADLVMVQQAGCYYCQLWDEEVGVAYPNSEEGRFAPLKRVNIRAIPDDIEVERRVSYTPTFLIVENGREIARLEGYPGAHFFWPLLAQMLEEYTEYRPQQGVDG